MQAIDKLIEFVDLKFSKEEKLYIAARLMNDYGQCGKVGDTPPAKTVAALGDVQKCMQEEVKGQVEPVSVVRDSQPLIEMKEYFLSATNKKVEYKMIRNTLIKMRPKKEKSFKSVLDTVFLGYGGVADGLFVSVLTQVISEGKLSISEDGQTYNWN